MFRASITAREYRGSAGHCVALLALCTALACASARAGTADRVARTSSALHAADPNAPPGFAAFPDVPADRQSPRVVQGLSLVRQVLADQLPTPPDDRRYTVLQTWIDQTVAPWIRARREQVDETRFQFAGGSEDEVLIALGVLGLMQENTALELSRIPLPQELDTEPEIADIFRDLVSTQAKPFRSAAVAEYRSCEQQADKADGELKAWVEFCRARLSRLHDETLSAAQASHP